MARAAADRKSVAFVGGGTDLGLGSRPARLDTLIRTGALSRLVDHAPADQVVTAEAGMTLSALAAVLARHGQRLALDAPFPFPGHGGRGGGGQRLRPPPRPLRRAPRPRPRGLPGPRRRDGRPRGLQGGEERRRVRPAAPHGGLARDAGAPHRGDVPAPPAPRDRGHRPAPRPGRRAGPLDRRGLACGAARALLGGGRVLLRPARPGGAVRGVRGRGRRPGGADARAGAEGRAPRRAARRLRPPPPSGPGTTRSAREVRSA